MDETKLRPLEWTDYQPDESHDGNQTYSTVVTPLVYYTIFKRDGQYKLWIDGMVTYKTGSVEEAKRVAWRHYVGLVSMLFVD